MPTIVLFGISRLHFAIFFCILATDLILDRKLNFKQILRDFNRLGSGARTVFFGAFTMFISAFLPWFQVNTPQIVSGDQVSRLPEISNAFGKFAVFGVLSVMFASLALLVFVQHFFGGRKTLGFSHGKWWLFLGAEILFVLIIALFVFSSEMQTDSSARIRFGLLFSLGGAAAMTFGGFITEKAFQKDDARAAFSPYGESSMGPTIRPEEPQLGHNAQLSFSDTHERG
jgi:hypothetical protein